MRNGLEGGTPPADSTIETKAKKWERRVEGFRKAYPHITDVLNYSDRLQGANSGDVVDMTKTEGDAVAVVNTDTGTVISKNREAVTEKLYGCAGIFIDGPDCNEMVHMTPSSSLGYKYHKYSAEQQPTYVARNVDKIISSLPERTSLEQCRAVIVVNIADESYPKRNDYHYEKQYAAWDRLKKQFEDLGLKNIKIVEVPMDESALYYTPERPDKILVMGRKIGINPDGSYDKSQEKTVDEIWVSLDPRETADYGIKRPMAEPEETSSFNQAA